MAGLQPDDLVLVLLPVALLHDRECVVPPGGERFVSHAVQDSRKVVTILVSHRMHIPMGGNRETPRGVKYNHVKL